MTPTPQEQRRARSAEAKAAYVGAMFAAEGRLWEVVGLDTVDAKGAPMAWLVADARDDPDLLPRDRKSRRVSHTLLLRWERVGFGGAVA